MTTCKPGDVVLVPFPFTDLQTTKRRPALVLASVPSQSMPTLLIVAMITSQLEGETLQGDYRFIEWEKASLLHPSKVRLAKLVTLEEGLIEKKIGALRKKDLSTVGEELRKVFVDWF